MNFEMKITGSKEYMLEKLKETIEYLAEGFTMASGSDSDNEHFSWIVRNHPESTPARAGTVEKGK